MSEIKCFDLENIWKNSTSQIPKTVSECWWACIVKKYNESGRNGHNYEFLIEKFKELDNFKHNINNLQAFILALFFQ